MIKVGILGAGFMGRTHAEAYRKLPGVELVGVANRGEQKGLNFARDFDCQYYLRPEKLITRQDVDIIDICLPTYLHEQYAVLAAQAGKHVLLEKPLALEFAAAERIVGAVERAGVKFMVAQVLRFWPEYTKIKEYYDQGRLGSVKMVYANRLAQHPNWSEWFSDVTKSGGGLFDLHLHDIDYLRHLLGPVQSLYASGKQGSNGAWNHLVTVLNFANGAKACVEAGYEMLDDFPFTMGLRVVGDMGIADFALSAGFNLEDRESTINRLVLYTKDQAPQLIKVKSEDAYLKEIAYFVECVRADQQPAVITPQESKEVLGIVLTIQQSLETGKVANLI